MDSYAICTECKADVHVNELQAVVVRAFGKPLTAYTCAPCTLALAKPRKIPALAKVLKAAKPSRKRGKKAA